MCESYLTDLEAQKPDKKLITLVTKMIDIRYIQLINRIQRDQNDNRYI